MSTCTCEVCYAEFESAGTLGEAFAGRTGTHEPGRGVCSKTCFLRWVSRRFRGLCVTCGTPVSDPRERACEKCKEVRDGREKN